MKIDTIKKISSNCFLLTLPILIWNIVLANKLPRYYQPDIFWKDIPPLLTNAENISRILVFVITFLMPLKVSTRTQKRGLTLYLCGTMLYFISWLVLIYFPDSKWSNTMAGFMAPAYSPVLWLTGIGLIGNSFYFNLPFKRHYFILAAIVFLMFHNYHTLTIYFKLR